MSYTNNNDATFTRSVTDNSGTPVYPVGTHQASGNSFSNAASNAMHNVTDNINNAMHTGQHHTSGLSGTGYNDHTAHGANTTGLNNPTAYGANTTGLNNPTAYGANTTPTAYGANTTGLNNPTAYGANTTPAAYGSSTTDQTSSIMPADKFKNSVFQVGPAGPSNIVSSLQRDHGEFRRLYNDFVQSGSMREREEIKNELIRGLSIHDFITETILFPAAVKEIPHGTEMVNPFKTKMTDFRRMLLTLDKTKLDDPTFLPTFHTMFQELDTSMKSKELELLPALTRALTPTQIEELGRSLDKARSSAPTRPHTSAATSNVLGHLAAPIDKLKDTARHFVGASSETRDVLGK